MTVTLTLEPVVDAVRVEATVPPGASLVTISRVGPSGEVAGVRAFVEATAVPGALIARDFEAPIGVPLTYTVTIDGSSESASIEIASTGCEDTWLTDLARPANSLRSVIESLPELAYAVPATIHRVLGRRPPIVSSDLASTPTLELSVLTDTRDERARTRALLGNGVPVLLRTPPEDGIGNLYLAVLGFAEQRIATLGTVEARRFVVSAIQVERPDPILFAPQGLVIYSHVLATFDTYADLEAGRATYDALLYDYAGSSSTDAPPWPSEDV